MIYVQYFIFNFLKASAGEDVTSSNWKPRLCMCGRGDAPDLRHVWEHSDGRSTACCRSHTVCSQQDYLESKFWIQNGDLIQLLSKTLSSKFLPTRVVCRTVFICYCMVADLQFYVVGNNEYDELGCKDFSFLLPS